MKIRLILLTPILFLIVGFSNVLAQNSSPIKEIKDFAIVLDKKGWISDENRINKTRIYPELDRKRKTFFNDKTFYPIPYESTMLNKFSDRLPSEGISLFKDAKSIWGYFYRDKSAKEWITDGVIEQWEFTNEKDAQVSMEYVHRHGHSIYFNTSPYVCRIRNYVIVFQSRAMAFSYEQKPVYDLFVKMYNPIMP